MRLRISEHDIALQVFVGELVLKLPVNRLTHCPGILRVYDDLRVHSSLDHRLRLVESAHAHIRIATVSLLATLVGENAHLCVVAALEVHSRRLERLRDRYHKRIRAVYLLLLCLRDYLAYDLLADIGVDRLVVGTVNRVEFETNEALRVCLPEYKCVYLVCRVEVYFVDLRHLQELDIRVRHVEHLDDGTNEVQVHLDLRALDRGLPLVVYALSHQSDNVRHYQLERILQMFPYTN